MSKIYNQIIEMKKIINKQNLIIKAFNEESKKLEKEAIEKTDVISELTKKLTEIKIDLKN